jgi:hypothetical protein
MTYSQLLDRWYARLGGAPVGDLYEGEFTFPLLRPWVLVPALILLGVLLSRWHDPAMGPARFALGNAVLLLLSAGVWFVVMRQHAIIHRHLVILLLPGLSLLLGGLAAGGVISARSLAAAGRSAWRAVPLVAVACALLLGFGSYIRESTVLNQIWAVDRDTRSLVVHRREMGRQLVRVGAALDNVKRLRIYGQRPELAYLLDRQFAYVHGMTLPDLGREEAFVSGTWTPTEKAVALDAIERLGFPEMASYEPSDMLVFRSVGERSQEVGVQFGGEYLLHHVRFGSSLGGDSWLLQLAFSGCFDAAKADDLVLACCVLDGAGTIVAEAEARVAWRLYNHSEAFSWHVFPKTCYPGEGRRLRIAIWSRSAGRFLSIDRDGLVLPPAAELDADARFVLWAPAVQESVPADARPCGSPPQVSLAVSD